MVMNLYAMQNGYFDDVAVDRIREAQLKMEDFLTSRKEALLDQIGNEKAITGEIETEIKSALADFKSNWK